MMMTVARGQFRGIEAEVADATRDDVADVGLAEPGAAHRLLGDGDHLGLGHRDGEPDGLGRVVEPVEVLLEPEDLPAVDADSLEDAVAVEQAVIEDGDLRRVAGVPFAVEPDGGLAGAGAVLAAPGQRVEGVAIVPDPTKRVLLRLGWKLHRRGVRGEGETTRRGRRACVGPGVPAG